MSFELKYNFENQNNYSFDISKIQIIGGVAKLLPIVSAPDVLLYTKLDENKGLVAIDSSGNDNHGAFQGGYSENQWTTGKINSAIQGLSTTSGLINFDQLLAFERTDPFSLEFWIKYTSTASQAALSKQRSSGNFEGITVNILNGKIRFTIRQSASNIISIETNSTYNDGAFHHVVCTYDGSSSHSGMNIYVDNSIDKTTIASTGLTGSILSVADFQISGRDGNNICLDSTSTIDEVLVYERELTAAEVAFRWNSGNGTQQVPGGTTSFPVDNPTIRPSNSFMMSDITDFLATVVEPGSDEIRHVMIVNNLDMWWNGSAWANSTDYSETNTIAEIAANVSSLLSSLQPISIKHYLHSDDGSTTPEIDNTTLIFDSAPASAVSPNECQVFGTLFDNQGDAAENIEITAQLTLPYEYAQESLITHNAFTTLSDVNGDWSMSLVENENMPSNAGYVFRFSGPGINYSVKKIVPDEITKNFSELVDL